MKKDIELFQKLLEKDKNLMIELEELRNDYGLGVLSPQETYIFLNETLIPFAKSMGYNFDVNDYIQYELETKENIFKKYELQSISGGFKRWPILSSKFLAISGAAATALAVGTAGAIIYNSRSKKPSSSALKNYDQNETIENSNLEEQDSDENILNEKSQNSPKLESNFSESNFNPFLKESNNSPSIISQKSRLTNNLPLRPHLPNFVSLPKSSISSSSSQKSSSNKQFFNENSQKKSNAPIGLSNVGLDCYLNSALISIIYDEDFSGKILSLSESQLSGTPLLRELRKITFELKCKKTPSNASEILKILKYNSGVQNDAGETLLLVINKALEESKRLNLAGIESFFQKFLGGYLKKNINAFETHSVLHLNVKKDGETLEDCIHRFLKNDDKQHEMQLIQKPVRLCLSVQRLTYDRGGGSFKINHKIKFSREITFENCQYKLDSVICHSGGPQGGHYTICKMAGGKWYEFSDDFVREISLNEVLEKTRYCYLFTYIES